MEVAKIKSINNIKEYIKCMEEIKGGYSFFLAVCDTPGAKMSENVLSSLRKIGFGSLSNELWRMYIGVVRYGETLIDCLADKAEVPVCGKGEVGKVTVEMESKSYIKGNKAVIEINGVECAVNKRGLNIVIYDENNNNVIDSICYDSQCVEDVLEHNPEIQNINDKLIWLSNDEKFDELAKKLISKYRLGQDNRVGLTRFGNNVGDTYYLVASVTAAKKATNKQYILISNEQNIMHTFVRWHNANGADIETICISDEEAEILQKGSHRVISKYKGIIDNHWFGYNDCILGNNTKREDIRQNLTRPKFPAFEKDKYIKKLGVVPGKTVFIIPDSVWHGSMPLYFWTMSIGLFQLMGYKVIVNAPENSKKYGDVTCFFPTLDDIVNFCDLCGILYTVRSGLSEVLCAETKAKCFVFTMDGIWSIFKAFPFIDNTDNHIKEIILPCNKKEEFSWIKNVADTMEETREFMRNNIVLNSVRPKMCNEEIEKNANVTFFEFHPAKIPFEDVGWIRCQPFCNVTYQFYQQDDILVLNINVNPCMEYIVHVALKNARTGKYVLKCEYYNLLFSKFDVEDDDDYVACVHIVHPQTMENCLFETEKIHAFVAWSVKFCKCNDYLRYISYLKKYKKDLVILIVSRDAHTNPSETRRLELEDFSFTTDLQHTYRHSWLAVIDSGVVVQEFSSPNKEVRAVYTWRDNSAELISAGFNVNGNDRTSVHIVVNGIERAVNGRGLNFVIWDKIKNEMLDSVCFDTFKDMKGYRIN